MSSRCRIPARSRIHYDNAQRVTKITNTAGETINYTLDAMGDVTALAIKDSGGTHEKIMDRHL